MYKLYNVKRWGSICAHLVLEELGQIPALGLSDGRAIAESAAIVAFLTDSHPDKGLAPPIGSDDHAQYLSLLVFMAVNLYPYIDFAFDGSRLADTEEQNAAIRRKGGLFSLGIFDVLENRLAEDGPFLLGDNFSAADIYLFMLTLWAYPSERAVLERYPHIASVVAHVRSRPRLKAALDAHDALAIQTAEAA